MQRINILPISTAGPTVMYTMNAVKKTIFKNSNELSKSYILNTVIKYFPVILQIELYPAVSY